MDRPRSPRKPTVLVLVAQYPPAYLAGGPTRSVPALVRALADSLDFRIVTSDHDLGERNRLVGIVSNEWTQHDLIPTLYLGRAGLYLRLVKSLTRMEHDVLYLNSVFSVSFTLLPLLFRRLGVLPRRRLVIAPRGELSAGALELKRRRKRAYLFVLRHAGLLYNTTWHAASQHEGDDIRRAMGAATVVVVAPNIPTNVDAATSVIKESGVLRIIFLGRIARKKNLVGSIALLAQLQGSIQFDIYGPMEDPAYWAEIQALVDRLPERVKVRYCGVLRPHEVGSVLASYELFLLLTFGENYGHAIVEALSVGCPVLISDRTPWRDLEAQRAGWDVSLDDGEAIRAALQRCVDMSRREYSAWSEGARRLGDRIQNDPTVITAYERLFPIRARESQVEL